MITRLNNARNNRGQIALILILLTAAALIFLAITLNWGRIARVKTLVTIAADQGAAFMASNVASYGEMEKRTYLKNTNKYGGDNGILMAILAVVVAIIVVICTCGLGAAYAFVIVMSIVSLVVAVANLVIQLVVIQPMITSMWNKLQSQQPPQQQFLESALSSSLQSAVGDSVNVTDYLDWNGNGIFGLKANEKVSRFAVFYGDRLKMINGTNPPNPAVKFFYDQLGELVNGENCAQNEQDVKNYNMIEDPVCTAIDAAANSSANDGHICITQPSTAQCSQIIPNSFLNESCVSPIDSSNIYYNPYCDPCCSSNAPKSCATDTVQHNCSANNPYLNSPSGPSYLNIYDSTYQNYNNNLSFLSQFGRDQQMGPFSAVINPQGSVNTGVFFPNGVYPFFWLMKDYSPEVDNIDPTQGVLTLPQEHWCVPNAGGALNPPVVGNPAQFPELAQLSLDSAYKCVGVDCCVNHVTNLVPTGASTGNTGGNALIPMVTLNATQPPIPPATTGGTAITITSPTPPLTGNLANLTSSTIGSTSGVVALTSGEKLIGTIDVSYPAIGTNPPQTFNGTITVTVYDQGPLATAKIVGGPEVIYSNHYVSQAIDLAKAGSGTLTVVAQDTTTGAVGEAVIVGTVIGNAPVVTIDPSVGNQFAPNTFITPTGTATENGSTANINSVSYYIVDPLTNNTIFAPASNCTFTTTAVVGSFTCPSWKPNKPGKYTLNVIAVDNASPPVSGSASLTMMVGLVVSSPTVTSNPDGSVKFMTTTVEAGSNGSLSTIVNNVNININTPGSALITVPCTQNTSTQTIPSDPLTWTCLWTPPAQASGSTINYTATAVATDTSNGAQSSGVTSFTLPLTLGAAFVKTDFKEPAVIKVMQVNTGSTGSGSSATIASATPAGSTNWVIDTVGSKAFPNPATNGYFGENNGGSWLEGDNQFCSLTNPPTPPSPTYNGSLSPYMSDGSCDWSGNTAPLSALTIKPNVSTIDSLDDTMHILSDFVKFSKSILNNDPITLSNTLSSWYDQAAEWVDPNTGKLKSVNTSLNYWNGIMATWLANDYSTTNTGWCVPQEATLLNGQASNKEDEYINANRGSTPWGQLPSVIACENYNSNAINFKNCLNALSVPGACPALLPPQCAPTVIGRSANGAPAPLYDGCSGQYVNWINQNIGIPNSVSRFQDCWNTLFTGACPAAISGQPPAQCGYALLGRSLVGPNPNNFNGVCDPAVPGSFAQWVNSSLYVAKNEAPKFALRSAFLTDLYTRANTMQTIFTALSGRLTSFLAPCSNPTCTQGGPAAQLANANTRTVTPTMSLLPNSVIYGWVDKLPNGDLGYAHLVKVTAYSPGRNGNAATSGMVAVKSVLPKIITHNSFLTRSFTLENRDGSVYMQVKRWDEDHNNPGLKFPNGRNLWQMTFHNPNYPTGSYSGGGGALSGGGPLSSCIFPYPGTGTKLGFGLLDETVSGMASSGLSTSSDPKTSSTPKDTEALANAFMLDDEGYDKNGQPTTGAIDPSLNPSDPNNSARIKAYQSCLDGANTLLNQGVESHTCAFYVASRYEHLVIDGKGNCGQDVAGSTGIPCSSAGTKNSGTGPTSEADYSIKFIDCNVVTGPVPIQEDLVGCPGGNQTINGNPNNNTC